MPKIANNKFICPFTIFFLICNCLETSSFPFRQLHVLAFKIHLDNSMHLHWDFYIKLQTHQTLPQMVATLKANLIWLLKQALDQMTKMIAWWMYSWPIVRESRFGWTKETTWRIETWTSC
jgi:hypothetical protein